MDDDENSRNGFCEVLEKNGHSVDTASNCFTALQKVMNERFDVLISDQRPQPARGTVLPTKVATSHPQMPVIPVTPRDKGGSRVIALNKCVADCPTKPLTV